MKEDKYSWRAFFVWLKGRGLFGVRLIIGDKNLGMLETIPKVFPDVHYQRCTVHFYRNIFSVTPRNRMKAVSMMLNAIHSQESKEAAREKALQIEEKLKEMKLTAAAKKLQEGIDEILTYMDFPTQHWSRIRTNNTVERLNQEIKRYQGNRCVSRMGSYLCVRLRLGQNQKTMRFMILFRKIITGYDLVRLWQLM